MGDIVKLLSQEKKLSKDLVVAFTLLGILIYLASGGLWKMSGYFNITASIELDEVELIDINLKEIDVIINFVEGKQIKVVKPNTNKESGELVKVKQDQSKLIVERKKTYFMSDFSELFTTKAVQINIPKSFQQKLVIETSSGDIEIQNSGEINQLEITTSSGDVKLESVSADCKMEATSGTISIDQLIGTKHEINTSSGDIQIQQGKGDLILTTYSGDIVVGQIQGDGSIEALSGDIEIEKAILEGDLTVTTASGEICIKVSNEVDTHAEIKTSSGAIESYLELEYQDEKEHHAIYQGEQAKHKLLIETMSGDIRVN